MKEVLVYLGMAWLVALFYWFLFVALPNHENIWAAIRACDEQHVTAEAFDECKAEYYRRREWVLPE